MAQLGIKKFDDLIGQTEFLKVAKQRHHLKSKCLDFSTLLYKIKQKDIPDKQISYRKTRNQDNLTSSILDNRLIQLAKPALEKGEKFVLV